MNTLIIYNGYYNKGGGVVRHIDNLKNVLIEEKNTVDVWSKEKIPQIINYFISFMMKALDLIQPGWGFIFYSYCTKIAVKLYIKKHKYNSLIFEDIFSAFSNKNIPFMIFIHALKGEVLQNVDVKNLKNKNLNYIEMFSKTIGKFERKKILGYHDYCFTVSDSYARFIKDFYSLDKELNVIENGLCYNELKSYIEENNLNYKKKYDFIYVGVLSKRKNVEFLINVFKFMKNEYSLEPYFLIVGYGSEENRLKELIQEYDLKNIEFRGRVDDVKEKIKLIKSAKALLLASLDESFSYVAAEAKLCGLYTFINEDICIPHYIVDFALPLNIKSWAESMVNFLNNYNGDDDFKKYYDKLCFNNKARKILSILDGQREKI